MRARECNCSCGCGERTTTTDDNGVHVCEECSDYYTTAAGDVVCSREQSNDDCRHCGAQIEWGCTQTGQPGVANWREGMCSCRTWTATERGSDWRLAEGRPIVAVEHWEILKP